MTHALKGRKQTSGHIAKRVASFKKNYVKKENRRKRSDAGARDKALMAGEKTYFTGEPCPRGHIAWKLVSNYTCLQCLREKTKERLASNEQYRRKRNDVVRQCRLANLAADAARHAKWKRANPDKIAQYAHTKRAMKLGAPGRYTAAEAQALLDDQGRLCANPYCLADLNTTKKHLDHKVPLSRGGSNGIENLQWLCESCNCRKWKYTHDEWIAMEVRA